MLNIAVLWNVHGTFLMVLYETRRSSNEKVRLFIFLDISFIKQTSNWRSHTNTNLQFTLHSKSGLRTVFSFRSLPQFSHIVCSWFLTPSHLIVGPNAVPKMQRRKLGGRKKNHRKYWKKILVVSCCLRCCCAWTWCGTWCLYIPRHDVNEKITRFTTTLHSLILFRFEICTFWISFSVFRPSP